MLIDSPIAWRAEKCTPSGACAMIELSRQEPFAIGGRRLCYVHPDDDTHCIKVSLRDKQPKVLKQSYPWWKRLHSDAYYDENVQDLKIYRHLHWRCGDVIHAHLPRVYGFVKTDLGPGLEMRLVRDADGRISLSGKGYTLANGITGRPLGALDELEDFLIRQKIQLRDPFPHNLVYQTRDDGQVRVFIVDGLARRTLLPFAWLPHSWMRQRVEKKMARLREGLEKIERNRVAGRTPLPKGLLLKR